MTPIVYIPERASELPEISDTLLAAIEQYTGVCRDVCDSLLFSAIDELRFALSELARKEVLEPADLEGLDLLMDDVRLQLDELAATTLS